MNTNIQGNLQICISVPLLESNSADNTNVQNKHPSEEKEKTENEIHQTKSMNYIKTPNDCKPNRDLLIKIDPLDKTDYLLLSYMDFKL